MFDYLRPAKYRAKGCALIMLLPCFLIPGCQKVKDWQSLHMLSDWNVSAGRYTWETNSDLVALESIAFAKDRRVWGVGGAGLIAMSSNGGRSWVSVPSKTGAPLHFIIQSPDSSTLWIVGGYPGRDGGVMLRSADSGLTWTRVPLPSDACLYTIAFDQNSTDMWTAGDSGTLLHSHDKGATWSQITTRTKKKLFWVVSDSRQSLVMAGGEDGVYLRSHDDAQTWDTKPLRAGSADATRSVLADRAMRRFWVVGDNGALFTSADSGGSWDYSPLPNAEDLYQIFGSADQGRFLIAGNHGTLLVSSDGSHWAATPSFTDFKLWSGAAIPNSDKFLVVGRGITLSGPAATAGWETLRAPKFAYSAGADVQTNQDGTIILGFGPNEYLLRRERDKPWSGNPIPTPGSLTRLWISQDGKHAFAAGTQGEVYGSFDSGQSWWHVPSGTTVQVVDLAATSDGTRLWLVLDDGRLTALRKSGDHWNSETQKLQNQMLNSIFVPGNDSEVVVSSNHAILRDRGFKNRWEQVPFKYDDEFGMMRGSFDGSHLYLTGDSGLILNSSSHGDSWTGVRTQTSEDLYALFCTSDGKMVWTASYSGSTLQFSSDFGQHWRTLDIARYGNVNAITGSADGSTLIMSTTSGIVESHDQGNHWVVVLSSNEQGGPTLHGIYGTSDGSEIWSVGEDGEIKHTSNGISWDEESSPVQTDLLAVIGRENDRRLWAAGRDGTILLRNSDGKWHQLTSGTKKDILALYAAPDGRFWAVGDHTVLMSEDGGNTWHSATFGSAPLMSNHLLSAIAGSQDGKVMVIAGDTVIFVSKDGGKTWAATNPFGFSNATCVLIGGNGSRILVATESGIIYRSYNSGDSWIVLGWAASSAPRQMAYVSGTGEIWAVGDNGRVVLSGDDGYSWNDEGLGTTDNLYGVFVFVSKDGARILSVGENGTIVHGSRIGTYANVQKMRLVGLLTNVELQLELSPDSAYDNSDLKDVSLQGTTDANAYLRSFQKLPIVRSEKGEKPGRWNIEFDPSALNLRPDQKVTLQLTFRTADLKRTILLPPQTYKPWAWVRNNLAAVISVAAVLLYLSVLGLLLLTRPLSLLRIQQSGAVDSLANLLRVPVVGDLVKKLAKVTLLEYFSTNDRVLDAWVNEKKEICLHDPAKLKSLVPQIRIGGPADILHNARESFQWSYLRLPIILENRGERRRVKEPSPSDLPEVFLGNPGVIQIIGLGGSGKSTLARQIATWYSTNNNHGKHPVLPILIDDECIDLKSKLTGILFSVFDEKLDDPFLTALLRRGRIVVIVDGLSERRIETQEYFRTIRATLRLASLILTGRNRLDFSDTQSLMLFPQPLDSSTLLGMVVSLIDEWRERNNSAEHLVLSEKLGIVDQLRIGNQLAKITDAGTDNEIPITPLLVRLYVEKIILLHVQQQSLENLPSSIPDIYFDYLRMVNPKASNPRSPSVNNWLPDELMVEIVTSLAKCSLNERMLPSQWIGGRQARSVLANPIFAIPLGCDPLQRLVDNGILRKRVAGADELYAFALDPLAEFAACFEFAVECGEDPAKWQKLAEKIRALDEPPLGFLNAMSITIRAYGGTLSWKPTEFFIRKYETSSH